MRREGAVRLVQYDRVAPELLGRVDLEIGPLGRLDRHRGQAGGARHLQVGLEREPDLPDVPTLIDLARNDTERAVFTFVSSDRPIGKSYVMPPEVPAERVEAMRQAFMATMQDADFLADAKAKETEVHPIPGAQLQELIGKIVATPPAVIELAERWMSEK